jgi:hypothetical protein
MYLKKKINRMKLFKINRKWLKAGLLCWALAGIVFFSCVYLDEVLYESSVKAGETATFIMKTHMEPLADIEDDRLIVAILVPKSWKAAQNTKVTYINSLEAGVVKSMSIIPESSMPKNMPGYTWEAALRDRFGFGPNVLDDMEWIPYQSDEAGRVTNNEKMSIEIKIETKTGTENLRAKLGFFVNHSDDGLGTSADHFKIQFTDCFEVTDGEGVLIDFCEKHFNLFQPSSVTKDDIVSLKFQGDIEPNDLDNAGEIFLQIKAYTDAGNEYAVLERNAKTRMQRELENGRTYSLTFWPSEYFGVPEQESITRIEYYFTNEDATAFVKETQDDGTQTWFLTPFTCK